MKTILRHIQLPASLLLLFAFVVATTPAPATAATKANTYCSDKYPGNGDKTKAKESACEVGFKATQLGNKTVEAACKDFTSANKAACKNGGESSEAKALAPAAQPADTGKVSLSTQAYDTGLPQTSAGQSQIKSLLQIIFGVIGALAVLMVMIGSLRFVTSQGNPQEVAKARNTVIYALIGVAVAIAAEAIVSFAINRL